MVLIKCPNCKEKKDIALFMYQQLNGVHAVSRHRLCNTCLHIFRENARHKKNLTNKINNKIIRDKILSEKLKKGEVVVCEKCEKNVNIKYYTKSKTICDPCMKYMAKVHITINHNEEKHEMWEQKKKFDKNATQSEKAEKQNKQDDMIAKFLAEKKDIK